MLLNFDMTETAKEYIEQHHEDCLHPWSLYVKPFRIFGNLYFVGNSDGASHLVDSGDGLILFDTNYPYASALLINSIWMLGFNPEDIKLIFHTHGHYDHFGSTALLKHISGAKTLLGAKDSMMFINEPHLALMDLDPSGMSTLFVPDVNLMDNQTIRMGATTVRCLDTAGHSPGAMTYIFNVSDGTDSYFAGLHGGAGFNTLSRRFEEEYHTGSNRFLFKESISRLKKERVDIFLGNHTAQSRTLQKRNTLIKSNYKENPFLNSKEWVDYLDDIEERFSKFSLNDPD